MNTNHHPRPQPSSSTTTTRPRAHPSLLAPIQPRRPPNRTTPHLLDDEIHTDPIHTSDEDPTTTRRLRKPRHASPLPRTRPSDREKARDTDPEFVTRQPDGGYLLGSTAQDALTRIMFTPEIMEAEAEIEVDAEYADTCRSYFTSGAALKATKRQEEEYASLAGPIMARSRQQAMLRLEGEGWMFADGGEGPR